MDKVIFESLINVGKKNQQKAVLCECILMKVSFLKKCDRLEITKGGIYYKQLIYRGVDGKLRVKNLM